MHYKDQLEILTRNEVCGNMERSGEHQKEQEYVKKNYDLLQWRKGCCCFCPGLIFLPIQLTLCCAALMQRQRENLMQGFTSAMPEKGLISPLLDLPWCLG